MGLISYLIPKRLVTLHSSFNQDIEVVEMYGKNVLLVNGIQQSGQYTQRLWEMGFKGNLDKYAATILVFGVGGGTAFHMLRRIYPQASIVGVDIDPEIIRISKMYFGLNDLQNLRLIDRDAASFAREAARQKKRYDLVIIDLYVGNDVPAFVEGSDFLKAIESLKAANGRVILNYFSYYNQPQKSKILLDRLAKIYQSVQRKNILRNIFFYCS